MLKEIAPHPTRAASIACAKNGPYDYFKRSAADSIQPVWGSSA
jgi:hypothetical protein